MLNDHKSREKKHDILLRHNIRGRALQLGGLELATYQPGQYRPPFTAASVASAAVLEAAASVAKVTVATVSGVGIPASASDLASKGSTS
jgi:hypothetical protein